MSNQDDIDYQNYLDDLAYKQYLASHAAAQQPAANTAPQPQDKSLVRNVVEQAAGAGRKYVDEFTGGMAGPVFDYTTAAYEKLVNQPDVDYMSLVKAARDQQDSFERNHPIVSGVAGVAGASNPRSIASRAAGVVGGAVNKVVPQMSGLAGWLSGMVRGGASGALLAGGTQELNNQMRSVSGAKPIVDTADAAKFGGAVGTLIPALAPPVSKVLDYFGGPTAGMDASAKEAYKMDPDEIKTISEKAYGPSVGKHATQDPNYLVERVRGELGYAEPEIQSQINKAKTARDTLIAGPDTYSADAGLFKPTGVLEVDKALGRVAASKPQPQPRQLQVPVYQTEELGPEFLRNQANQQEAAGRSGLVPRQQAAPQIQTVSTSAPAPKNYPLTLEEAHSLKETLNRNQQFSQMGPLPSHIQAQNKELAERAMSLEELIKGGLQTRASGAKAANPNPNYNGFVSDIAPEQRAALKGNAAEQYQNYNTEIHEKSKLLTQMRDNFLSRPTGKAMSNSPDINALRANLDAVSGADAAGSNLRLLKAQMDAAKSMASKDVEKFRGMFLPIRAAGRGMLLGSKFLEEPEVLTNKALLGSIGLMK